MTRTRVHAANAETEMLPYPDVTATLEWVAEQKGVFGGPEEATAFLRAHEVRAQGWALESGASLKRGDVALRVRGAYRALGPHTNAIAGILAVAGGWTTAARALTEQAKPAPVIFRGATNVHPALRAQLERAAVAGGCLGADAVWNRGRLPQDAILLNGDTVRALRAWDAQLPRDIPRLTPVDVFYDETDEVVRVALAVGEVLGGIVLMARETDAAQTLDNFQRTRQQLGLAGFPRVKIFLDGAISVELLDAFQAARVLPDGFFVGEQIAAAPPLLFAVRVRECEDMPLIRRGESRGTTPSPRLKSLTW